MILRFRNLKSVKLYYDEYNDPLVTLNDNDQQDVLAKSCPKLKRLEYENLSVFKKYYFDLMYKLRHSLTWLNLTHMSRLDDVEKYLADFPHLQAAWCQRGDLDSFEKCLPLIEKLPTLNDIIFGQGRDEEGFAERYLSSKTKDEQSLFKERLSRLTHIVSSNTANLCVNGAKFILRYLTGLKYFSLYCYDKLTWTAEENEVFISLLNYACNLEEFYVTIDDITLEGLSMCLKPLIFLIQSYEMGKTKEINVEFSLFEGDSDFTEEGIIGIDIDLNQDCRSIDVDLRFTISSRVNPYRILDLFESIQLDQINLFIFGTVEFDPRSDTYKSGYESNYSSNFSVISNGA